MNISLFLFISLALIPLHFRSYVPFVSQAPFGNWQDPRQQDACEEAAALMAVMWAKNQNLTQNQALEYILNISVYESQNYGQSTDTSAGDTLDRIIKGYFNYLQAELIDINSFTDLINPLKQGKLLIVPTNGRFLENPNYTGLGPERHNLVIKGYDSKTREFITNDPGTRKGENYRYPKDVLFSALRDYPTGVHLPITHTLKTAIVVSKF